MLNERALVDEAIAWIKERRPDAGDELSYRLYADMISIVIAPGYKYQIPLDELRRRVSARVPIPACAGMRFTAAAGKLAHEHDINLKTITGTGKAGLITVADVRSAINGHSD